eukprot:6185761-Pleurochrysis_carterae.AAC.2
MTRAFTYHSVGSKAARKWLFLRRSASSRQASAQSLGLNISQRDPQVLEIAVLRRGGPLRMRSSERGRHGQCGRETSSQLLPQATRAQSQGTPFERIGAHPLAHPIERHAGVSSLR